MREFSAFEQKIIKNCLIEGSGLSYMLSERENVKWLVRFNTDTPPRFEFRSDLIEAQPAYNELIDLIELLLYLIRNGLVRTYQFAATDIEKLSEPGYKRNISLGDSESTNIKKFIPLDSEPYANFIADHENSRFVALAPLRALADRNFVSAEDFRHNKQMRQTKLANAIASFVALAGIALSVHTAWQNQQSREDLILQIGKFNIQSEQLQTIQANDSIRNELLRRDYTVLRKAFDSLRKSIPKITQLPPRKKKVK